MNHTKKQKMKLIEKLHLQKELHLLVSLRIVLSLFFWIGIPFTTEMLKIFVNAEEKPTYAIAAIFWTPFFLWHSIFFTIIDITGEALTDSTIFGIWCLGIAGSIHTIAFVMTIMFWCKPRLGYLLGFIFILLLSSVNIRMSMSVIFPP